jgi:uncharacterized protein (TIGR03790 family)
MRDSRPRELLATVLFLLSCASGFQIRAGGTGLNTVVIVNQNSAQSCELGNYFCERRQVPPDNVLRIAWPGGNISWTSNEFQMVLLAPLLDMLASRQLTGQVDYAVLSMDIPFQTVYGTKINSTTSALFYGLKDDSGAHWRDVTNSYCASETIFRQAAPASAPGYSFLASMITANSLTQAKQVVDQGVTGDRTFPTQPAILAKSSDPVRNVRYHAFDNAIFNCRVRGDYSVVRTNADTPGGLTNLLGYQTGLASFSISPNAFVAGAMADSLTSFGGIIFGPNSQTTLLAFINAGAAGSYGTVTEPSSSTQKFPDPQDYFYQSRGFSLAECYYQGLYAPYQGLVVAEPLAAPFAQRASARWTGIASNAVLSGTAQLGLVVQATDAAHPIQQIDLFVDGKYSQTLTNLAPCPGNVLSLALNGYPISYTVPTDASISTVAKDLTALLNASATTNLTRVIASLHGDRIELRAAATNAQASPFFFADTEPTNSSSAYYRVRYLPGPISPQLSAMGRASDGTFRLHVETPTAMGYVIQATTDFAAWVPIFTNATGAPLDFVDGAAAAYPKRFYRVAATAPDPRPSLTPVGPSVSGGFKLRAASSSATPYAIEASTNLVDWTFVYTNQSGGTIDFVDASAKDLERRFYRAVVLTPALPGLAVVGGPNVGGTLIQLDAAAQSYVVLESSDLVHWAPIFTNLTVGQFQTTAGSSPGSADTLTTFVNASRGAFLNSTANGLRGFKLSGTPTPGAWLQLGVTKTNGTLVSLSVTNQSVSATLVDLAQRLTGLINSSPDLQGRDGLIAEDVTSGAFGTVAFNLSARGAGLAAAAIQVQLSASLGLGANPPSQVRLDADLSDLQPRNHLYVTTGARRVALTFPLDTTTLADGFHELTAVAYEGSHVRTQTRVTVPVQIQNSPLAATLTFLDAGQTAPVQGTYHAQVVANTNSVSVINLYSTGGVLGTVTNQSTATFTVEGAYLGAGLHPFYAVVLTGDGMGYRTPIQRVRLVGP